MRIGVCNAMDALPASITIMLRAINCLCKHLCQGGIVIDIPLTNESMNLFNMQIIERNWTSLLNRNYPV
jgi:hypothetical protein